MIKFPPSARNPGQTHQMRTTPSEAVPVRIKSTLGTRSDNRRDPLLGDKPQTNSAQGV
jgi:hypothetical protein